MQYEVTIKVEVGSLPVLKDRADRIRLDQCMPMLENPEEQVEHVISNLLTERPRYNLDDCGLAAIGGAICQTQKAEFKEELSRSMPWHEEANRLVIRIRNRATAAERASALMTVVDYLQSKVAEELPLDQALAEALAACAEALPDYSETSKAAQLVLQRYDQSKGKQA